eukprot:Ihof_evm5s382 gene=Ihof_evmTU5s382
MRENNAKDTLEHGNNDYDFTRTEKTGWCTHMGNAFGGSIVGIILFIGSLIVIFWNERNAVHSSKAISEALGQCSDQTCIYSPQLKDKLIHISCDVNFVSTLHDDALGVTYHGLQLVRYVEMFQWLEETLDSPENASGKPENKIYDYRYRSDWSDTLRDSSMYQNSLKRNPVWPLETTAFTAEYVRVGGYVLKGKDINRMHMHSHRLSLPIHPDYHPSNQYPPTSITVNNTQLCGDKYYYTGSCSSPEIGDMRFSYRVSNASAISVVGVVAHGRSFTSWNSSRHHTINPLVVAGQESKDDMFQREYDTVSTHAWWIRVWCLLAGWGGLQMFFRPFSVAPDVIPVVGAFIGGMVGRGFFFATLCLTLCFGLIDMSIAWLFYSPPIGLFLLSGGLLGLALFLDIKKRYTSPTRYLGYDYVPSYEYVSIDHTSNPPSYGEVYPQSTPYASYGTPTTGTCSGQNQAPL